MSQIVGYLDRKNILFVVNLLGNLRRNNDLEMLRSVLHLVYMYMYTEISSGLEMET